MDPNPYKFSASNPRLVEGAERSSLVYTAAGIIFAGSLAWYNKRIFRVDQNAANFAAFAVAGIPAAYSYANFALSDAETEAACINNDRELQRQ